jgi:hypothetical protein
MTPGSFVLETQQPQIYNINGLTVALLRAWNIIS